MNDLIQKLATFAPALIAQMKGDPVALEEFTKGYQSTMAQIEEKKLREQQMKLGMEDRQRLITRQTEQDRIAQEERDYGKSQNAIEMLSKFVPAQETMGGAETMSQSIMARVPEHLREGVAGIADQQLREQPQMITDRQRKQAEEFLDKWAKAPRKPEFDDAGVTAEQIMIPLPDHLARYLGKPQASLAEVQQFARLPVGKPAGKPTAEKPDFTLGDTRYRADGTPIVSAQPKPEKPARTGYRFLVGADGEPFEWPTDQSAPRGAKPYDAVAARNKPDAGGPSPYSVERETRTLASVDELMGKVGRWTTGFGSLLARIPESAARNFQAELSTLKANIAFNELTQMREASKTGGALGQVSNLEMGLLESALGALDAGQSPDNIRAQLEKIKASITRWRDARQSQPLPNGTTVTVGAPKADPLGIRKPG